MALSIDVFALGFLREGGMGRILKIVSVFFHGNLSFMCLPLHLERAFVAISWRLVVSVVQSHPACC